MLTGATHKRVFLCPYSICKMLQSPHAKICKVISCYCTTRGSMLMRHNTLHLLMQSICPQPGPKCTCAYPQPAIMLATLFIFLCHQPSVLPYCTHSYVPELPFYQCLINPLQQAILLRTIFRYRASSLTHTPFIQKTTLILSCQDVSLTTS